MGASVQRPEVAAPVVSVSVSVGSAPVLVGADSVPELPSVPDPLLLLLLLLLGSVSVAPSVAVGSMPALPAELQAPREASMSDPSRWQQPSDSQA